VSAICADKSFLSYMLGDLSLVYGVSLNLALYRLFFLVHKIY
jgi:hypothetical protein